MLLIEPFRFSLCLFQGSDSQSEQRTLGVALKVKHKDNISSKILFKIDQQQQRNTKSYLNKNYVTKFLKVEQKLKNMFNCTKK